MFANVRQLGLQVYLDNTFAARRYDFPSKVHSNCVGTMNRVQTPSQASAAQRVVELIRSHPDHEVGKISPLTVQQVEKTCWCCTSILYF